MTRFLLDTDHVSLQERGHEEVLARMASVPPDALAISVITVEELIRGRLALLARKSEGAARVFAYGKFMETVRWVNRIRVIAFDMPCEQRVAELQGMRIRVGSQDMRIAATAMVNGLTLVTRNRRDFGQIPGLTLQDWSVVE